MPAIGGTYVGKLFDRSPGHPAKHTFIKASRDRENGHLRRAQKVPEAVSFTLESLLALIWQYINFV